MKDMKGEEEEKGKAVAQEWSRKGRKSEERTEKLNNMSINV